MSLGPVLDIRAPRWSNTDDVADGRVGRMLFDPDAETEPVDLDLLEQRAAAAVEQGFDARKFDLDVPGLVPTRAGSRSMPPGAETRIVAMADAVTRGAGDHVEIAFDLHWRYDMSSALRICEALSDRPIMWLEDPVPPENIAGLIALSGHTTTPLGGGENLIGHRSFEPLLRSQALSVVTPDLGKVGGVAEARRVAESAADNGIAVAPHNIAGPVGTAVAAQVASTWPNRLALG